MRALPVAPHGLQNFWDSRPAPGISSNLRPSRAAHAGASRQRSTATSSSMRKDFVLDALEQALYARQPERDGSLI